MDTDVLLLFPHFFIALAFIFSICPFIISSVRFKFQAFAHGFFAIGLFFFPTVFLKTTVNGDFTPIHGFIQSFCASVHVGQCFLAYRSRNDVKHDQTITFAGTVTSLLSLICKLFAAWHLNEKSTKGLNITDNFILVAVVTDGVWFVTEIIRYCQNRKTDKEEYDDFMARRISYTRMEVVNPIETALFVDAGIMFTYAMLHFAYPSHILKLIIKHDQPIDSHHILWCRLFGVFNLLPAIVSVHARFFPDTLRVNWMASRLISQCVVFLLNIYGHWVLSIYSANHITAFMISGFFSSFLFSAFHRVSKLTSESAEREHHDLHAHTD